jgi:hypothetical protein
VRKLFAEALWESEDSRTLNTSFVGRHNLTTRQGCSYLHRRSTGHARSREDLKSHLDLLRGHYNFVRRHMAFKYGRETWTPAMQAGLVKRPLTFRQIFLVAGVSFVAILICVCRCSEVGSDRKAA